MEHTAPSRAEERTTTQKTVVFGEKKERAPKVDRYDYVRPLDRYDFVKKKSSGGVLEGGTQKKVFF